MDLGERIGWGIVIYAIVFLASSGMALYGLSGLPAVALGILALLVVCVWAGYSLRFHSWTDILPYSIGWAAIAIGLDAIFAVPQYGWDLYSQWTAWASYLLVALLPLLAVFLKKTAATPRGSWET